jgi:predicted nuclease of predicted toxin-antitoxin system
MKFLADMGISPKTVSFLTSLAYDAVHLKDQGLQRVFDSFILEKALNEGRVLLTHDLDFAELLAASGGKAPSVVVFRLRNMHPDRVNICLNMILKKHIEALEKGVIISVDEGLIRVRYLPIWTISG